MATKIAELVPDMRASLIAEVETIQPEGDYLLVSYVEPPSSGVMKSDDIRDSKQYGIVLAVGPGDYRGELFVHNKTKVGDLIMWEEAAEANTPPHFRNNDVFLIKEARKIATIKEAK
jgi:co-chaperonin GroES (HSP10)